MSPREREAAQRRGQRKLDAMRRRATQLRERVVVIAIAGFVLLWTVVFVQMATGNDPVLTSKAAQRTPHKVAVRKPERPHPQATPPDEEAEAVETEQAEAEQFEVERLEAEEAEARELAEIEAEEAEAAELESITSGQS